MRVVLYGASGRAGSRVLRELVTRGHAVTAAVRDANSVQVIDAVSVIVDDLSDPQQIARNIGGADAVISAYAPPQSNTDELVAVTGRLIEAVKESGVPRLLMVGGAASLEVAPGVRLLEAGLLPPEWLPISRSHVKALEVLRACEIDWTYLSPAAYFDPGERTGKFRLGTDTLIADEAGNSRISMEDFAIAMVDELERPQHRRQRFTLGY